MKGKKSGEKGKREKKRKTIEKKGTKTEKVCEIFEIEKGEKEKTIKSCGVEEQETGSKEQIKKENEILKNFFIWAGIIAFAIILIFVMLNSVKKFEYKGVEFNLERYGDLIFYRTRFPVTYEGKDATYNFYIRNDPRKLEKEVPFNGELVILKDLVINSTENLNCNGDGIIAIANLLNLYNVIGTEVIKDENATCDDIFGRYVWVNIKEGNNTEIGEFGLNGACYNIYVNNCEILPATERFLLETLI